MIINGTYFPVTTIDGLTIVDYPDNHVGFEIFDPEKAEKITKLGRELSEMISKVMEENNITIIVNNKEFKLCDSTETEK